MLQARVAVIILVRAPPLVGGLSYSLIKFLSFYENVPTDTHMQFDLTRPLFLLRVEQIKGNLGHVIALLNSLYFATPPIKKKGKKKERHVLMQQFSLLTK